MALERQSENGSLVMRGEEVTSPFHHDKREMRGSFEAWLETRIGLMPEDIQEMMQFVPREPLEMHYHFEQRQAPIPGFHNQDHVMGAIEFALRYFAYSSEENDPLNIRRDKRHFERVLNVELSDEDFLTSVCVGLAFHDICEIATGQDSLATIKLRDDGYRGRRPLEGHPIAEAFSAGLAYEYVIENHTRSNAIAVATLAHHIALQTTFSLPKNETPFDSFVRAADRYSGLFNHNPAKDYGMICEIFAGNPEARVNLRDEYNFHQLHGREILHDPTTEADILTLVLQNETVESVLEVDELYPPEQVELSKAFVILHGLYVQGMTPFSLPIRDTSRMSERFHDRIMA